MLKELTEEILARTIYDSWQIRNYVRVVGVGKLTEQMFKYLNLYLENGKITSQQFEEDIRISKLPFETRELVHYESVSNDKHGNLKRENVISQLNYDISPPHEESILYLCDEEVKSAPDTLDNSEPAPDTEICISLNAIPLRDTNNNPKTDYMSTTESIDEMVKDLCDLKKYDFATRDYKR